MLQAIVRAHFRAHAWERVTVAAFLTLIAVGFAAISVFVALDRIGDMLPTHMMTTLICGIMVAYCLSGLFRLIGWTARTWYSAILMMLESRD